MTHLEKTITEHLSWEEQDKVELTLSAIKRSHKMVLLKQAIQAKYNHQK
jgi:hypothetical protein